MDIKQTKDELLLEVKRHFFFQIPFRCFNKELKNYVEKNAEDVFMNTISHKLNQKYPLKKSYQASFLKSIINALEAENEEVEEKFYHNYLKLIETSENEAHYIHYVTSNDQFVSIFQNTSIISEGTTGLSVWQAGKVLADYCSKNSNSFRNKKILELGCGVGLTGLVILRTCDPSYYCFTDTHDKVLSYLVNNIKLNMVISDLKKEDSKMCFDIEDNDAKIYVANLTWGEANLELMKFFVPDIILAADVIYDSTLFHPFCHTIDGFLKQNRSVKIFIACTIRNIVTLKEFFSVLHEFQLIETEVEVFTSCNSSVLDDCIVKIFSLSSTS